MRRILAALCVGGAVVLACRSLEVPGQGSGSDGGLNPGPDILFVTPHTGDTVALSQFFSLDVEDPNGVRLVRLSCNGQELKSWDGGGPDFQGVVELGRCQPSDAGGPQAITVLAEAWDVPGSASQGKVDLTLDTTVASVALVAPERVMPHAPLALGIRSDTPLQAPPQLLVDGAPVRVTEVANSGMRQFQAQVAAPGLGVETWDGGSPDAGAPLEVLSEVERQLPISVDAVASSGATTHVEGRVLLSRIVWQANVPGALLSGPLETFAVATDGGLQVPLDLAVPDPNTPNQNQWLPGFFTVEDGTYVPFRFDPSLPTTASAQAFDALGRTLMYSNTKFAPSQYFFLALGSNAVVFSGTGTVQMGTQLGLTRVGRSLCQERYIQNYCGSTARTLACVSADAPATSSFLDGGSADPSTSASTARAGSGTVYLGTNAGNCGTGAAPLPNTMLAVPLGTNGAISAVPDAGTTINRLLPTGDGSFILATNDLQTQLVGPQGNVASRYAPASPNMVSPVELAAWPNHGLLRLGLVPPDTVLEAFPVGGGPVVASGRIPGMQPYVKVTGAGKQELPLNVVVSSTGEVAVLVKSATAGFGVAVFDAALRPRWLYRYPQFTLSTQLVGEESSRRLYLIDLWNGQVVSLAW